MKKGTLLSFMVVVLLSGCIGDDLVFDTIAESVSITNPIDNIEIGTTYQFNAQYLNNIGMPEPADIFWLSSAPDIVSIDATGLATAKMEGTAIIRATVVPGMGDPLEDNLTLTVSTEPTSGGEMTRTGTAQSTSSYTLSGDFALSKKADGSLELAMADNFQASSSLPGLYVYLTNNPSTNNNALEIGPVTQFTGAHSYDVPGNADLGTYNYVLFYCKPFSVKVGDGEFDN